MMACMKLVLEGIQEMVAEVEVTLAAFTEVGLNGASFPITIVQPASFETLLSLVTDLTLILWI